MRLIMKIAMIVFALTLSCTNACAQAEAAMQWEKFDWGELGAGKFDHAPFPDDSRTTGYARRGVEYPAEKHYTDSTAIVALPKDLDTKRTIDFIVLFHGHGGEARRFVVDAQMGEILHATKRNAILVAPQGPKNVPDSSGGKFEKQGEFALFMAEVLQALKEEGRVDKRAVMGNLLVGGFSGGGRPLGFVLEVGGMDDNIKEAWILDAAYEQHDSFAKPFTTTLNTTGPQVLRSLYTDHLTTRNMELIEKIRAPKGRPVEVVDDAQMTDFDTLMPALMRKHQLLFMHTTLPHDAKKMSERYLGPLISTSRYLRAVPTAE